MVKGSGGGKRDQWGLRVGAGTDLLTDNGGKPVRLVDLALWYGRNHDVEGIGPLVEWFIDAFGLSTGDLIGTIYSDAVPPKYLGVAFLDEPMSQSAYADTIGGMREATPVAGSLDEIVTTLEKHMEKQRFKLAPGLVGRVIKGWLRGDLVILVGQPGTGKTRFANLISEALTTHFDLAPAIWIPVRGDFDEAELIGYERLDGSPELKEFALKVLQTTAPLDAHLVILEEFNLATIETYLAGVLVATQDRLRRLRLPGGREAHLPVDTFILATCNSYLDEPETRTRLSFPTKRRSTIITMGNILFDQFERDGESAIVELAVGLIVAEVDQIESRQATGRASTFDHLRMTALKGVNKPESLSAEVREALTKVVAAVLGTPEGSGYLTMGLLRDVALAIAHAARDKDSELRALGDAVADKVVPQLRGPHERADLLLNAVATLPSAPEIARLLDRMKSGPPEELLQLI